MNRLRRITGQATATLLLIALIGACGSDPDEDDPGTESTPTDAADPPGEEATETAETGPTEHATDAAPTLVTLERAEEAALAAVGEGEVTWSGPEDDRGAAWEIEITRPNGTEVDVLVAADGTIVY